MKPSAQKTSRLEFCPHCGCDLVPLSGRPRSRLQHRRLFGLVKELYFHWPEAHWFKPKSENHLRYWLTHKAGYSDVVKTIRVQSVEPHHLETLLTVILRTSDDERTFIELDGELITVTKAHSIAYHKMPQRDFAKLCTEIDAVIETETGLKPRDLLRESQAA